MLIAERPVEQLQHDVDGNLARPIPMLPDFR